MGFVGTEVVDTGETAGLVGTVGVAIPTVDVIVGCVVVTVDPVLVHPLISKNPINRITKNPDVSQFFITPPFIHLTIYFFIHSRYDYCPSQH